MRPAKDLLKAISALPALLILLKCNTTSEAANE
jgi:hypothetical protein